MRFCMTFVECDCPLKKTESSISPVLLFIDFTDSIKVFSIMRFKFCEQQEFPQCILLLVEFQVQTGDFLTEVDF